MAADLYFGGVPVAPDVDLLIKALGSPSPGDDIDHEKIEEILGLKRAAHRYRTVTQRWMATLWDDRNVRVVGRRGGFRCLLPHERLDQSERQRTKGARRLAQAVKEAITTPPEQLASHEVLRREQLMRTNALALIGVKNAQSDYGESLKRIPECMPRRRIGESRPDAV